MSVTFTPHLDHVPDDQAAALYLSNANAKHVLGALGYTGEALSYGEADPDLFLGRVLLAQAISPTDPGRPWTADGRWHDGGRRPGYLHERLAELRTLAEDCRARGVHVTWG